MLAWGGAVLAAGLASCAPARRHEAGAALRSFVRHEAASAADPAPVVPAPVAPEAFFLGSEDLVLGLPGLPRPVAGPDGVVRFRAVRLPPFEEAARRAARAVGRRDVVTVFAFGAAFPVPWPPSRYADRVLDAAHERRALGADEVVEAARSGTPGREARWLRIALLDLGEGPFRYDFRWTLRVAREDLPDGRVLLRYDLDGSAPRERISAFRGAAVVEPTPSGGLVRELLVVGSPLAPPPFLGGKARDAARDLLARRWTRLREE